MPLTKIDCHPKELSLDQDQNGNLSGLLSRPSSECLNKDLPVRVLPNGFLPTQDTRSTIQQSEFNIFLNSLPDWPIFKSDVIVGLTVGGLLALWLHRYERKSKAISQARQKLR